MPYDANMMKGRKYLGAPVPIPLHKEFSRLCRLAGRSMAKELETAVSLRTSQLQRQERQGVINGVL